MKGVKGIINDLNGGCSSFSWTTEDNKHLWGRNFDYNRIAQGSMVTYIPRCTRYYCSGTCLEHNLVKDSRVKGKYAAVGIGTLLIESTPTLYEGINEKGLMGGQLNYRCFANYKNKRAQGTMPVQPSFAVTYLLTQCSTVKEVIEAVKNKITLVSIPLLGIIPMIHWIFADKAGDNVIIEPDKNGLSIYYNSMGVMTNSPSYSWHRLNLLNYFNIRNLDYYGLDINGDKLEQCFSGNAARSLPGDWSSPSRFIRLSFLKKYGIKGNNEEEGVTNAIHLFNNVAFPLGLVEVSETDEITENDTGVIPYDYTIYTSVMCSESLKYYWVSYENQRVQCVDLNNLLKNTDYVQFDLDRVPDFKNRL